MRPIRSSLGVVVMTGLTLAGCVSLTKSYPEKKSFVLDAGASQGHSSGSSPEPQVLKINRFRVAPFFAGRAMVYRTADLQYESDYYNEWFVAPGTMLTQQFTEWVSGTGLFQFVLMGTNHVEPTLVLEGTVTELYGDFRRSGQPKAILGIDLHLFSGPDERKVVLRRSYRQEVPLSDSSADHLAQGLTQALRLVLTEFRQDVSERVLNPSFTTPGK